jgi:hypothetical protein
LTFARAKGKEIFKDFFMGNDAANNCDQHEHGGNPDQPTRPQAG